MFSFSLKVKEWNDYACRFEILVGDPVRIKILDLPADPEIIKARQAHLVKVPGQGQGWELEVKEDGWWFVTGYPWEAIGGCESIYEETSKWMHWFSQGMGVSVALT